MSSVEKMSETYRCEIENFNELLHFWFSPDYLNNEEIKRFLSNFCENFGNICQNFMDIMEGRDVNIPYKYRRNRSMFYKLMVACVRNSGFAEPIYGKPHTRKPVHRVLQIVVLHIICHLKLEDKNSLTFKVSSDEVSNLANFEKIAELLLPFYGTFKENRHNVLAFVVQYVEGHTKHYVPGSGQTQYTKDRQNILLEVSDLEIEPRRPRKPVKIDEPIFIPVMSRFSLCLPCARDIHKHNDAIDNARAVRTLLSFKDMI